MEIGKVMEALGQITKGESTQTIAALAGLIGVSPKEAGMLLNGTLSNAPEADANRVAEKLASYFGETLKADQTSLKAALIDELKNPTPESALSEPVRSELSVVQGMKGMAEPHPLDQERAGGLSSRELAYVLLHGGIEAAAIQQAVRNSRTSAIETDSECVQISTVSQSKGNSLRQV